MGLIHSSAQTLPVILSFDGSKSTQFRAITVNGTLATNDTDAIGVLHDSPRVGGHATLVTKGRCFIRAGEALSAGVPIRVGTDGYFFTSSGAHAAGFISQAINSGDVAEAVINLRRSAVGSSSAGDVATNSFSQNMAIPADTRRLYLENSGDIYVTFGSSDGITSDPGSAAIITANPGGGYIGVGSHYTHMAYRAVSDAVTLGTSFDTTRREYPSANIAFVFDGSTAFQTNSGANWDNDEAGHGFMLVGEMIPDGTTDFSMTLVSSDTGRYSAHRIDSLGRPQLYQTGGGTTKTTGLNTVNVNSGEGFVIFSNIVDAETRNFGLRSMVHSHQASNTTPTVNSGTDWAQLNIGGNQTNGSRMTGRISRIVKTNASTITEAQALAVYSGAHPVHVFSGSTDDILGLLMPNSEAPLDGQGGLGGRLFDLTEEFGSADYGDHADAAMSRMPNFLDTDNTYEHGYGGSLSISSAYQFGENYAYLQIYAPTLCRINMGTSGVAASPVRGQNTSAHHRILLPGTTIVPCLGASFINVISTNSADSGAGTDGVLNITPIGYEDF